MDKNILLYLFIAIILALAFATSGGSDGGPEYYDKGWQVPGN